MKYVFWCFSFQLLDENAQLIQAIVDYQNKGKAVECVQYQQLLHKNLVYLASLADSSQNIQAMLPPPPANQMPGNSPGPGSMGIQGIPANPQDRKISAANSMDPNSTGLPNIIPQAITSGSQNPGAMPSAPSMTTTGDIASHAGPYGSPSVSMGVQPLKTSNTPPVTGYPGAVNQLAGSNMVPSSQSMLPGQQGYMPGMHPQQQTLPMQQHPQGQQFMMQQNVPMGYNRASVQQMHSPQQAHQPQQISQQPYMSNQAVASQQAPGMVPYQQPTTTYDPYNQMQHIPGYNPYGPQ